MKELYVIYKKDTGFQDGGAGRIDREWDEAHKDVSTISEYIERKLAENPDRAVIFLPDQGLPDFEKHKIKDGKIVEMTEEDIQVMEIAKPPSEIELLKERIKVLEDQLLT